MISGSSRPLSKLNAQIDGVERLPDLLRQAFRSATSGCPMPVHLEVAGNFGQAIEGRADLDGIFETQFARYPAFRPVAEPEQIQQVAQRLAQAKRPVIVAGGGVASSSAQAEVMELAQMLGIPVATSLNAKGTIAENHRLSVGVVGLYSRDCANRVVVEADLVFFIGSHTGSQVTNGWQIPRPAAAVIQLDIDAQELGRNYPNVASLCGDAKATLRRLIQTLEAHEPDPRWLERVNQLVGQWRGEMEPLRNSAAVPIRPERLCREVEAFFPDSAVLVSDTGHAGIWTGTHIELKQPGQTYLRAAGSLGWAVPAALGAKCAEPDRPVICFTGDGGFYYHMAELETAIRYGLNVVIVINDNHALSQEADIFADAYGGRQQEGLEMWQFQDIDLAAVARSMGCFGVQVRQPDQIQNALAEALDSGRPAVVDVVTDINALAPEPWS